MIDHRQSVINEIQNVHPYTDTAIILIRSDHGEKFKTCRMWQKNSMNTIIK